MRLSRVQFFWLGFMGRFESEKKIGIEYISNIFYSYRDKPENVSFAQDMYGGCWYV